MSRIDALPSRMLMVSGAVFCLIALASALLAPEAVLIGWLAAFVFLSAFPLGALCLIMMMRIIPGGWRNELITPARMLLLLLPLTLVASLPVLAGLTWIYGWAHAAALKGLKQYYLTLAFFSFRTLVILLGACCLALVLLRRAHQSLAVSCVGLIVFVPLHTVLSVDWLMSLDVQFHSSGFGLYILAGQMSAALSLAIILRLSLSSAKQPALLGALLLTSILLWLYLAFMQYFIIWSGNLPQGVAWFQRRGLGAWGLVENLITILHLLPLLLLLLPPVRRSSGWLVALSFAVLCGRLLEYAWLTMPVLVAHLGTAVVTYLLTLAGLLQMALAVLSRSAALFARLGASQKQEALG